MNIVAYFKKLSILSGHFRHFFYLYIGAEKIKHKGVYMKIKIKYEIKDTEGTSKKTFTKTFSQINEASQNAEIKNFAEGYLSLVDGNSHEVAYTIFKANEEKIESGQVL